MFFAEAADQDASSVAKHQHIVLAAVESEVEGIKAYTSKDTNIGDGAVELKHDLKVGADAIHHTISTAGDVGCEIHWRRRGAQFDGRGTGEQCAAYFALSDNEGAPIRLSLSETEFWVLGDSEAQKERCLQFGRASYPKRVRDCNGRF